VEEVMEREGPVLICVKTVPNIRGPQDEGSSAPAPAVAETEFVQARPQSISNLLAEFGGG